MSKPDARTLARQAAEREAARRGRLIAADGPTFTDVSPDPAGTSCAPEPVGEPAADPREAGCLCGRCGRRYRVDVLVPDALWSSIASGTTLLCPRCIADGLEVRGEFAAFRLVEVEGGGEEDAEFLRSAAAEMMDETSTSGEQRIGQAIVRLLSQLDVARRKAELQGRQVDRFIPCPDHRDKVRAGECQVCRAESAERAARQSVEGVRPATITVGRYREVDSVRMLAEERWRQIEVEGWTAGHDDDHYDGELARAAEAYLFRYADGANATIPGMWPARWHHRHWKPSDDPIRNLVKAGALILAEIDRLLRAAESLARERGGPLP